MDVSSTIFQPIFEGVKQYIYTVVSKDHIAEMDDFMDGYKGTI